MADTRYCTAGRNSTGAWFIACREPQRGSRAVLDAFRFTEGQSAPPDRHYDIAARHVRDNGGLFWTTNASGEYLTIAGIPRAVRSAGE